MNLKFAVYLFVIIGFSLARADAYVDFFRAVKTDNASAVRVLLAGGFDPNTPSDSGQAPLHLAIKDESAKVVELLLGNPAVKIEQVNPAGETPLMMAALRGRLDWTRQLVGLGAKVRREGWTPLHYGATGPNVEVVRFLLDQGADINAIAPNGASPLMMAARYGPEDSVRLLIARGADKRVRNSLNQSAVDYARMSGREFLLPLLQ
jgi:ankyrin repeat protein